MNYTRAREIFFYYRGSKFLMWKEGDLDEYMDFNVPGNLEIQWQGEYLRELKEKINSNLITREKNGL